MSPSLIFPRPLLSWDCLEILVKFSAYTTEGFSSSGSFAPQGIFCMSGLFGGGVTAGGTATDIWWVEARETAKYPMVCAPDSYPAPVLVLKLRNPHM